MNADIVERIKKDYPRCFRCKGPAEHVHHAFGRDKRFKKYLDMAQNLIMLCYKCNVQEKGFVENPEFRRLVWEDKIKRGYDMHGWVDSIPMRDKTRFNVGGYYYQAVKGDHE